MKKLTTLAVAAVLVILISVEGKHTFAESEKSAIASPAYLAVEQDEQAQEIARRQGQVLLRLVMSPVANPGLLEVDDDGAECPEATYTTIQAAVDDAAGMPGSQNIHVCAGTYPENVAIGPDNSVKIVGDGWGNTKVTGVANTDGPIIDVTNAGKVDIERLTVDGGSAMDGSFVWGIRYIETDGKIKKVKVLNIRNGSGNSQGVGIRVESTGTSTKVTVEQSLVQNYTRVGINGNGVGVKLKANHNVINGPVLPRVWAPNGIQVSRGAEGDVVNNLVDNNPSPNPPGGAGSGIILFCAGPTEVHNNTVTRADLGISIADNEGAKVHSNDISNSQFDAISLQFIGNLFGNLGCPGHPVPTTGNHVHNNRAVDSADTGISFANFDLASNSTTPNANSVHNNDVEDSGVDGIHVFDGENNEIKSNKIENSGNTDAVDDTTGSGTAGTANTWKNNKCSTSSPTGLCRSPT